MKPFTFEHWHAWQGTAHILLSDERASELRYFKTVDDCINWLFLNGSKDAARVLNKHNGASCRDCKGSGRGGPNTTDGGSNDDCSGCSGEGVQPGKGLLT